MLIETTDNGYSGKSIHRLIPDIYKLIGNKDGWFSNEMADRFGSDVSKAVQTSIGEPKKTPRLRLSQMGPRCPKALWHSIHTPELAEPLPPWAEIKYTYGHILEHLVIGFAKAAGHEVTGEQDELSLDGIIGHRDCVIDGAIVDVKSASTFSFQKFKDKSIGQADTFGYLDQIDGYVVASMDDPLVRVKDRGYLLAIDKTLGHLCIYEHIVRTDNIRSRIREYKRIVELSTPPACQCGTVADGKSGNVKLDTRASYSVYKYACNPNLRTFLYASGPVYLVKVVRKPDVQEIDQFGKYIYH